LETTPLQQQIALSILKTTSNKKVRDILDNLGDDELFFSEQKLLLNSKKIIKGLDKTIRNDALQQAKNYLSYFEDNKMELLYYKNENFPYRLLECADFPITLFQKGKANLNADKMVAIVGTRNITAYGKAICENLIESFKGKNITVISGLAFGVDVYVHELCIKHNVKTVGVLGHGFDTMYPAAHRGIARDMIEQGALISEFLPDTRADKIHFPMRNRIIAGLSDATIVVESALKGGSLITADMANGYNRDVFAFPGNVFEEYSKGCNQLIKQNKAQLINSGEEFLSLMNWDLEPKKVINQPSLFDLSLNLEPNEKEIFNYIKRLKEVHRDEITIHFQHFAGEIFGILLQLEMNNLIEFLPSGKYRIKISF
jgi:DNA processing protein